MKKNTKKKKFNVQTDISKAKTLHKDFYLDGEIFKNSGRKIFEGSWQFIGDESMLAPGHNIRPFTLLENFLDEPLVLTRNESGTLKCLSNVCTHRGNIIATESCHAANLRCKYHGRIFNLDGTFRSMPEFKEVKNFPSKSDHLKNISLFNWKQFLFVSTGKPPHPEKFFDPFNRFINPTALTHFRFRPDLSKDYRVNAHWALYCENFLEGFHIPFVHAGLNELIDFGSYKTEAFGNMILQTGYSKNKEHCFELGQESPDFGKNVAAYYFFIFPNMMFNFYPWGLSVNIVKPISISKSVISFLTFVADESKLHAGAGGDLHRVELEDEEVVEQVQRGIRSKNYAHGRYSVTREQGVHLFHRMISKHLS